MYVFNNFNTLNELGGSATSYIRENIPLIPKYLQNRKFTEFFPLSRNPYNQLSPLGKVGVVFFTALSFSILFLSIWKGVKCNYFQNTKIKKGIPSQSQDTEEDRETSNKEKIESQVRAIFHELTNENGSSSPLDEHIISTQYPELPDLLSQMSEDVQKEYVEIFREIISNNRISKKTSASNSGLIKKNNSSSDQIQILEKTKIEIQVRAIFYKLKKDLKKDLLADESIIYSRYPELPVLLSQMSQNFQKKFDKIVEVALIRKQILKNPATSGITHYEKIVLQALGYTVNDYLQRKRTHAKIKERLLSLKHQVQKSTVSIKQVIENIEKINVEERLLGLGITPKQLPIIQTLIAQYKKTESDFKKLVTPIPETLFPEIYLEDARKYLHELLASKQSSIIESRLEAALKNLKDEFLNSDDIDEVRKKWSDECSRKIELLKKRCSDLRFLEKKIKWFENYQGLFVHEFNQSDYSESEINGDGICFGLVCRMALNTIRFPTAPISRLKITPPLPQDRFYQGFLALNINWMNLQPSIISDYSECSSKGNLIDVFNKHFNFLPSKNKNIKHECFYALENSKSTHFISDLAQGRFIQSGGGVILGRGNHATFLCVDRAQHRYFFFDPNFGMLQFHQNEQEELVELIERMLTCYDELYEASYNANSVTTVRSLTIENEISS